MRIDLTLIKNQLGDYTTGQKKRKKKEIQTKNHCYQARISARHYILLFFQTGTISWVCKTNGVCFDLCAGCMVH